MDKSISYIILTIFIVLNFSCFSDKEKNTNQSKFQSVSKIENTEKSDSYKFLTSKTGYTETILDKFHHIQISGTPKANIGNIDFIKSKVLANQSVMNMIDSLDMRIDQLNLTDSIRERIFVDFIDHNQPYCQIHKSFCIFRHYMIFKNHGNKKISNEIVNIKKVKVQGLPISNYPLDSLLTKLGKPDSIFYTDPNQIEIEEYIKYYYENSVYYSTKNYPFCALETFQLTPETIIELDGITLDYNTTIEDLKNNFPLSYLNIEIETNSLENSRMRILNSDDKGQIYDSAIILRFTKGVLKEFEYWINDT